MIKSAICGLEKLLVAEILPDSLILVTGAEGTLKSSLVFSLISNHLAAHDEHGLYVSLEQSKESHLLNMNSLGLKKRDKLHIFDYRDMLREWKDREPDLISMTDEVIDFYRDKYNNLTIFALDSLNALYSYSGEDNSRKMMYHFFSNLRDKGLTSFLILESPPSRMAGYLLDFNRPERFLADGIIELGIIEGKGGVKRYIQILKMRATKHAMEKHQITIETNGLQILGPIY
jgi:KaiC/GvpD/RAD55 family RecA-like ATPase